MDQELIFNFSIAMFLIIALIALVVKSDVNISITDELSAGCLGVSVNSGPYHNAGKIIKTESFGQGTGVYHNYLIKMSIDSVKYIRHTKSKSKCINIKFYCGKEVHYIKNLSVDTFVSNPYFSDGTYELAFYKEEA
jgi:hypothetical protein